MRVRSDDHVGAGVDQGSSKQTLIQNGHVRVFDAPMFEHDDDIGFGAGSGDIFDGAFFFPIEMTDQGQANPLNLTNDDGITLRIGGRRTEVPKTGRIEPAEHFQITRAGHIERMIVGDGNQIEPGVEQKFRGFQRRKERLTTRRFALRGNDAFEVPDEQVIRTQALGDITEWKFRLRMPGENLGDAQRNGNIACKSDDDAFRRSCGRGRSRFGRVKNQRCGPMGQSIDRLHGMVAHAQEDDGQNAGNDAEKRETVSTNGHRSGGTGGTRRSQHGVE